MSHASRSAQSAAGGDERLLFRDRRLHAEAVVPAERVELVDHLEARRAPQVVDDGQIREHVEARLGMVAERRERLPDHGAVDPGDGLPADELAPLERAGGEDRGQPIK